MTYIDIPMSGNCYELPGLMHNTRTSVESSYATRIYNRDNIDYRYNLSYDYCDIEITISPNPIAKLEKS